MSHPGRLGEVANGLFQEFQFAAPRLGRLAGLEKADRPRGVALADLPMASVLGAPGMAMKHLPLTASFKQAVIAI